ncbi:MAG: 1-hydroxycarotenoid 3,4-desaturase CrtD [Roseobacter sp.]
MNFALPSLQKVRPRAIVIGGGVAGLACTLRLQTAGYAVSLLERHAHLGGKIRTLETINGPADAGPTVLTMRKVFDDLFACAGEKLDAHVTLIKQDVLARHFWPDGSQLDLFSDPEHSAVAIDTFAGTRAADEFRAFHRRTRKLFDAFDAPMMQRAEPSLTELIPLVMADPSLLRAMAPLSTLAASLQKQFSDPRLAQLFGRYATYVGGAPQLSPALLSLIWQAEAAGVWVVEGGMHKLTQAMTQLCAQHGADIHLNTHVDRLDVVNGRARGVTLASGARLSADAIVFAGDPRALASGQLGPGAASVARQTLTAPRSFSARVHSFAAEVTGKDLAHHNVFFNADPSEEFDALAKGRIPKSPSLYLCALDRAQNRAPPLQERFEMISNAPATQAPTDSKELDQWHLQIMQMMKTFDVRFTPQPTTHSITTPQTFSRLFPASEGALYGQSPHGMTAALKRPRARTSISGLWLCGGGTHPGAGVPMATISARHAAEAILHDQTSASTSAPMATPGGMSTG